MTMNLFIQTPLGCTGSIDRAGARHGLRRGGVGLLPGLDCFCFFCGLHDEEPHASVPGENANHDSNVSLFSRSNQKVAVLGGNKSQRPK